MYIPYPELLTTQNYDAKGREARFKIQSREQTMEYRFLQILIKSKEEVPLSRGMKVFLISTCLSVSRNYCLNCTIDIPLVIIGVVARGVGMELQPKSGTSESHSAKEFQIESVIWIESDGFICLGKNFTSINFSFDLEVLEMEACLLMARKYK